MNEDFKHLNLPWYPLVHFTSLFSMKTIDDAASVYNVPPEFGSNTCMMALYITELLTFSYGFPVNTKRIYSFKDINGKSLSKIKRTFVIMKKNLIYNINWYICRSFHPLASVCKIDIYYAKYANCSIVLKQNNFLIKNTLLNSRNRD